jgi:hypothetical protein
MTLGINATAKIPMTVITISNSRIVNPLRVFIKNHLSKLLSEVEFMRLRDLIVA